MEKLQKKDGNEPVLSILNSGREKKKQTDKRPVRMITRLLLFKSGV